MSLVDPPYTNGQEINVDEEFGLTEVEPGIYRGKKPLNKPAPIAIGSYGGNLCGQALLAAMQSSRPGFKPHSVHAYFVKPVTNTKPVDWHVEKISDGANFCNRQVRGYQDDKLKYITLISLTKKNSHKKSVEEYEEYFKKLEEAKKAGEEIDEDEDDAPLKPFGFQTPYSDWFKKYPTSKIELDPRGVDILCFHKLIPQLLTLDGTEYEEELPVTERKLSWYAKWGINESDMNYQLSNVDEKYQFFGLSVISESLFMTRLCRSLRTPDVDLTAQANYWSVSLDHIIYFHDDDFDSTDWMGVTTKPIRLVNKRAVCEAEIYNSKGVHVATCFQEAITNLNNLVDNAKL